MSEKDKDPLHSSLIAPQGVWWKPAHKQEKRWVTIAFIWCMILFGMMPFWHIKGGQNPTGIRSKVTAEAFSARVDRFVEDYKVGEITAENGRIFPVVAPPAGSDIYLLGKMWEWYPVLKLEKNKTYTLHLSSVDLNHGFNLYPINVNFQVVPGYDYGLKITPTEAGEFTIVCNEFCGIGHHLMTGRVIVEDKSVAVAQKGEQ